MISTIDPSGRTKKPLRDFTLPPQCKWDLRFYLDFMQRRMVVSYRRFGTSVLSSRVKGQDCLTLEDGTKNNRN
jgi:hypothetical protein